ncbi:aspartate aminotransferase [Trichoderma sp. SZMC 28012]
MGSRINTMLDDIEAGPPDPMYTLKKWADGDTCDQKADLGVGIYRNEAGVYQEMDCIKQAKVELSKQKLGHDYEVTTGNPEFLHHAARLIFSQDCSRLAANHVASVQTISGTGANHLAVLLLAKCIVPQPKVFIGTPSWGNYKPMLDLVGLSTVEYPHYDEIDRTLDFPSILAAITSAPRNSVFIFQSCCHNPTGSDPSQEQWHELAMALRAGDHIPLFDSAYQGLGRGLEEDSFAVRLFAKLGFSMIVCQSFSKNFGLYGERCGALHIVCGTAEAASATQDRLRCLIRWEFSSSPAYGSRLVNIVQSSAYLKQMWITELSAMRHRLYELRQQLYNLLSKILKTPGHWGHIIEECGLFSFLKLSPRQCSVLIQQFHIYLPPNGRINISGLNKSNIERVARAIDYVVRLPDA